MIGQLVVGIILLGAAGNHLPLLLHAVDIARRHTAREGAALVLSHPDLMQDYGVHQTVLLVPLAVLVLSALQARARE